MAKSKLKGIQVSIANCQRSDLQQAFNKVSHLNFRRFMTISSIWIQFWPWKTYSCALVQLARLLHFGTKLLSCSSVIVWLFLSLYNIFVLTFISGFFGATNSRIWCCFEESIAVEERDLLQVGVPTGSGTSFPFTFAEFLQKIVIGQRW